MAEHVRTRIRKDIATTLQALVSDGTVKGVIRAPGYPVDSEADLPGLAIRSGGEEPDEEGGALGESARTYAVEMEASVLADENQDDTLDAILLRVEEELAADRSRGGLALDTRYEGTAAPDYDQDGNPIAYIGITFQIDYRVPDGNPDDS